MAPPFVFDLDVEAEILKRLSVTSWVLPGLSMNGMLSSWTQTEPRFLSCLMRARVNGERHMAMRTHFTGIRRTSTFRLPLLSIS